MESDPVWRWNSFLSIYYPSNHQHHKYHQQVLDPLQVGLGDLDFYNWQLARHQHKLTEIRLAKFIAFSK